MKKRRKKRGKKESHPESLAFPHRNSFNKHLSSTSSVARKMLHMKNIKHARQPHSVEFLGCFNSVLRWMNWDTLLHSLYKSTKLGTSVRSFTPRSSYLCRASLVIGTKTDLTELVQNSEKDCPPHVSSGWRKGWYRSLSPFRRLYKFIKCRVKQDLWGFASWQSGKDLSME